LCITVRGTKRRKNLGTPFYVEVLSDKKILAVKFFGTLMIYDQFTSSSKFFFLIPGPVV
jgi:hypothetical protein